MLSNNEIREIFKEAGAIITGQHFVYAKKPDGWYHGADYVNKDAIYLRPDLVGQLCEQIATSFWATFYHSDTTIDVVVGPTVGGVALSQWTSCWLSRLYKGYGHKEKVLAVFADEEADGSEKRRVIKRGYDKAVKNARCLIVEDIINSGTTVMKTRDAIVAAGGQVVGVGCLCNRSGGKVTAETLGVPHLISLLGLSMQMFREDECPICREKGPRSVRTDLGKGKEFLVRKGLV